jgi:hypothetical protein
MLQLLFLGIVAFRNMEKQPITIANFNINLNVITIILTSIATILVSIALFFQVFKRMGICNFCENLGDIFTLDHEMNIPAIFSSLMLLMAAGLLFFVYTTQKKHEGPFTRHWIFLSVIFLFLAYDEMFSFHEGLIGPLRKILVTGGVFSYEWVILAIPLVFILAISYSRFLINLPTNVGILVVLAGAIYVGGSIGGEMLSGWYASNFLEGDANYILLTIFEETLEMSGMILFIHAILLFLFVSSRMPGVRNHLQR